MGIRTIIATGVIGLAFLATSAKAVTNNWNYTGSDFWDTDSRWSTSNAPSIFDAADTITNVGAKVVTIDDTDSAGFPGELTISNLIVAGTSTGTNTLSLSDMNSGDTIPLHILNGFTVGSRGVLQITNSMLQVDGAAGGTFQLIGAMQVLNDAGVVLQSAIISNAAVLLFALGSNTSPVVVSNNLTLGGTLNVIDGGGLTTTNYTLFTYGGALTYSGLAIGTVPTNFVYTVSTNTAGQIDVVVAPVPVTISPFRITSIGRSSNDVMITWTTIGPVTNAVQAMNGGKSGYTTNGFQDISGSTIIINATGATTTNYTDSGGATNTPTRYYRIRRVP